MDILCIESRFVATNRTEPAHTLDYPGSGWRGALGHALKCRDAKAYDFLFESPLAESSKEGLHGSNAPHPFVLFPTNWQAPNYPQIADMRLVIVGSGIQYAQSLHQALVEAAAGGVHDIQYEISSAPVVLRPPCSPNISKTACVTFQSPLRLRHNKTNVTPTEFTPSIFLRTLVRRQHQLALAYQPDAAFDLYPLLEKTDQLEFQQKTLFWKDGERFSSRQNAKVPLGGMLGAALIQGEALPDFWDSLWLGQWLHAGKGAVMGLGHYQMTPVG